MATIYYAFTTSDAGKTTDMDHAGTASTAADILELRMGNGVYSPDRRECLLFLQQVERWIRNGGLSSAGANLPQPTGPR